MSLNYVEVLNIAKEGHWNEAHQRVQTCTTPMACLIHGYLHLVEGDLSNAKYWYTRAEESLPTISQDDEYWRLYELAKES